MRRYFGSSADKQKLNKPKTRHGKSDLPNANLLPWTGGKKPGSKKPKFAKGGPVKGNPSDDLTPKGNLPSHQYEGVSKPRPKPKKYI